MSEFLKRKTTLKGLIGERIVRKFFENKKFIIYQVFTDGAHPFDLLGVQNKDYMLIIEIKTKSKRNCCPDTGFDYKHYKEYVAIFEKYKIDIFIAFVDESLRKVYGNFLENLMKKDKFGYPKIQTTKKGIDIIYFYQPSMINIGDLVDEEVEEIKSLNTRNHDYVS